MEPSNGSIPILLILSTSSSSSISNTSEADFPIGFAEFVALLALMMSLTALSIDAMLPALPIIGADLNVQNPNDNQLVISGLFLGLAVGQLFYGPMSDTMGRKLPLYIGLTVFIVGTILSIVATSLFVMVLGRVIQGFGLASPRTVSLAMIRDRFQGNAMAQVMSFIMLVFILVPVLAPTIGQQILSLANWQAIYVFILSFALLMLLWFRVRMPETLPVEKRRSFSMARVVKGIQLIFTNRRSLTYTLTAGLVSGGFVGFLNASQQIFADQYGIVENFPYYFAALAISLGVASVINSKLVMIVGSGFMVKLGGIALLLTAAGFLGYKMSLGTELLSLSAAMVYLMSTLFWIGILFGNLNSMAMEPLGTIAGIGSAMVGAVSTFISVAVGTFISLQYAGSLLPILQGFTICGGLSLLLIFWEGRKRFSHVEL